MFMPPFRRFSNEAAIIGRLLAGYGEIDLSFAVCTAQVLAHGNKKHKDTILRAIFRMKTESARVNLADTLIHPKLAEQKLAGDYSYIIGCIKHCLKIRNQFSHCHWADYDGAGLFFTNLEDAAEKKDGFDYEWLHIDVPLLVEQENLFFHTVECLWNLEKEYLVRIGFLRDDEYRKMPKRQQLPMLHNLPELHPPPWRDARHAQTRQQNPARKTNRLPIDCDIQRISVVIVAEFSA